jgi:[protein-PII] uridylyltransferase
MPGRAIERPEYATVIRDRLREQRERALREISGGEALCHALSDIMDRAIRQMLEVVSHEAEVEVEGSDPSAPALVILATGGYGRYELSPGSDIDITFVPSEEGSPGLDEVARRMYHLLMDLITIGADLKVGYAYRLIDDCDGLEHPTQTALLDARPIAGSVALAHRFADALMDHLRPAAFAYHKAEERKENWLKYGETVFCVEPNLKEGPGGLRDLQAAGWIARARYGIRNAALWPELRGLGLISDRELTETFAAKEFLLKVRHRLHQLSGRQNDTLSADRQEELAPLLGFESEPVPVIALMHRVYDAMATIHRTYRRVSDACLDGPFSLDRRLIMQRGLIRATDPDLLDDDPTALSRIFHHFQEFGFKPDRSLEDMIRHEARRGTAALQPERLCPLLLSLLRLDRAAPALRLMSDLGLLDRALPEFSVARTLTPLNAVHRFTVGEHSLTALDQLEALPFSSDSSLGELRRLYTSGDLSLEILRLALLLHDLGKATPERNHAQTGLDIARSVADRMNLDTDATELLEFLTYHHQTMSETAQLRDLTDDQTIRDFVEKANDVERLRLLYLMTYADMSATGPGVWTAVASRFIEDLFYRAETALLHGLPDPTKDPGYTGYRRRMRQELSLHHLPAEEVDEHCSRMPAGYLLNTSLEEIAAHVRAIDRVKNGGPVADFFPGPGNEATVIALCAYDDPQPGLLSKIAAVLFAHDIELHAAQVFTREGEPQIAIDTLWAEFNGGEIPPLKRRDLEKDLLSVISGKMTAPDLLKRRGKKLPAIEPPTIEIRNDLSERHSVVEVDATDARGLLYRVTRAIARLGWDIHSARISTLEGEARDAFYVTDAEGRKLSLDPAPLCQMMCDGGETEETPSS